MNLLKKFLPLSLALTLVHLSIDPAVASASRSLVNAPIAPVQTPILSAPALKPAAAAPMLGQMGAEAMRPSGDIAPYYTGQKKAGVSQGPVAGVYAAPVSALKPASVPERRAPVPSAARRLRGGRQSGKISVGLAIAIGVAAVIVIAVGAVWSLSGSRNDFWQKSKSNQDIVAVEKARRAGDAETLFTIAAEARGRQARMSERLSDAKSAGAKKVDDKTDDSLKTAEAYAAFDGLAGMRAEENANAVSSDAERRVGKQLPAVWKDRLAQEEAAARQSGQEGRLALQLKALNGEIAAEDVVARRFEKDIKRFDEHVPGLFGGRLKEMEKKASADLNEFNSQELGAERSFYQQYNAAMRQRVSQKLAAASPEYQEHLARLGRLADAGQFLAPAVDLAAQVDKDLKEMGEHEHNRVYNLMLAAQNESVEVIDYDQYGKAIGSHYEDHSGTFKALAASEGSAARASAASAQAGIKAVHALLPALRKDKTLQQEGLLFALPDAPRQKVGANGNVFFDFWLPASWTLFGTMFSESQAEQARVNFAPVLSGLRQVQQELNGRVSGETGWTDQAVDKDLERQMAGGQ